MKTAKKVKENPKKNAAPKPIKTSAKKNDSFPRKELDKWLKKRTSWNHDDWNLLLEELKEKGYEHIVATSEGQGELGNYLETHRRS